MRQTLTLGRHAELFGSLDATTDAMDGTLDPTPRDNRRLAELGESIFVPAVFTAGVKHWTGAITLSFFTDPRTCERDFTLPLVTGIVFLAPDYEAFSVYDEITLRHDESLRLGRPELAGLPFTHRTTTVGGPRGELTLRGVMDDDTCERLRRRLSSRALTLPLSYRAVLLSPEVSFELFGELL